MSPRKNQIGKQVNTTLCCLLQCLSRKILARSGWLCHRAVGTWRGQVMEPMLSSRWRETCWVSLGSAESAVPSWVRPALSCGRELPKAAITSCRWAAQRIDNAAQRLPFGMEIEVLKRGSVCRVWAKLHGCWAVFWRMKNNNLTKQITKENDWGVNPFCSRSKLS